MALSRGHYIAIGSSAVLVVWMFSGILFNDSAQTTSAPVETENTSKLFSVQVQRFVGKETQPELAINGQTAANRIVNITSETDGKVIKIHAREGDLVTQGQLIIELDPQDKPEKLLQAKANLKQRSIELDANKKLVAQGLQNQTRLAESEALLAQAQAQVKSLQVQFNATKIRAPFAGVLENGHVELGSYLKSGNPVISLLDYNPFIIKGHASEKDMLAIKAGMPATGKTLDGATHHGKIRYLSTQASQTSRSFTVELEINNPSGRQFNGVTAQIVIPLNSTSAIFISPALLNLNDKGLLGAKFVNQENVVEFAPVTLVKAEATGVWVSGLPSPVDLIISGQSFVSTGEKVNPVFKQSQLMDEMEDPTAVNANKEEKAASL